MNVAQAAQLLEEDIRKAQGSKLIEDAVTILKFPDLVEEVAHELEDRLQDWEIKVTASLENLFIQKSIRNRNESSIFIIEISRGGASRLSRRETVENISGEEIILNVIIGTTAKSASRMLELFRPPSPNVEFMRREGTEGLLALTVGLEKDSGPNHFDQLSTIRDWCIKNDFSVTSQMEENFWSEVVHDFENYIDAVIDLVDNEGEECSGVIFSNNALFEEIIAEGKTKLITLLNERGKVLYACDTGEIKLPLHEEFALRKKIKKESVNTLNEESDVDLSSVLEQIRIGIDQLEFITPDNHNYSFKNGDTVLHIIQIEKNENVYSLRINFYGKDGKGWCNATSLGLWESLIKNSKKYFEKYEQEWNKRYK